MVREEKIKIFRKCTKDYKKCISIRECYTKALEELYTRLGGVSSPRTDKSSFGSISMEERELSKLGMYEVTDELKTKIGVCNWYINEINRLIDKCGRQSKNVRKFYLDGEKLKDLIKDSDLSKGQFREKMDKKLDEVISDEKARKLDRYREEIETYKYR